MTWKLEIPLIAQGIVLFFEVTEISNHKGLSQRTALNFEKVNKKIADAKFIELVLHKFKIATGS